MSLEICRKKRVSTSHSSGTGTITQRPLQRRGKSVPTFMGEMVSYKGVMPVPASRDAFGWRFLSVLDGREGGKITSRRCCIVFLELCVVEDSSNFRSLFCTGTLDVTFLQDFLVARGYVQDYVSRFNINYLIFKPIIFTVVACGEISKIYFVKTLCTTTLTSLEHLSTPLIDRCCCRVDCCCHGFGHARCEILWLQNINYTVNY